MKRPAFPRHLTRNQTKLSSLKPPRRARVRATRGVASRLEVIRIELQLNIFPDFPNFVFAEKYNLVLRRKTV